MDFENIDTNNFFIQMMIFKRAEDNAIERMRNGTPTQRQQEESNMKELRDRELESYQWTSNSIAFYQGCLKREREWEKRYPNDLDNKYERMKSELRLAQAQAEFELYRPLWVHLGILPEDDVHKQDKTLQYIDLLSMSNRIFDEAQKKKQELFDAADPKLRAWITAENEKEWAFDDRAATLTNEAERELVHIMG